ncbi:unnamed protein product [Closterium sp. NIES-53]
MPCPDSVPLAAMPVLPHALCPALRASCFLPSARPARCPASALLFMRVALPCSPYAVLPCSPCATLPCNPRVALPCSQRAALPCSPRAARPATHCTPCCPRATLAGSALLWLPTHCPSHYTACHGNAAGLSG